MHFLGWKLKEHQPAWEKKDMEGFPSLPNCLLRFGLLSRIFWGSNAISPGIFFWDLFLFRFFSFRF